MACEEMGPMPNPKVYADFQNADAAGRVRLNCVGTVEDLARQQIALRDGLELTLYDADAGADDHPSEIQADGVVQYSSDENCWVAIVDWSAFRCVQAAASFNGSGPSSAEATERLGQTGRS
jgi:hypothetical protein